MDQAIWNIKHQLQASPEDEGRRLCSIIKKNIKTLPPEHGQAVCELPSFLLRNGERLNMCQGDQENGCVQNTSTRRIKKSHRDKHAFAFAHTLDYTKDASVGRATTSLRDITGADMTVEDNEIIHNPRGVRDRFLQAVVDGNHAT
eukprot:689502-Pleurochrysis_carterae.AAC.1